MFGALWTEYPMTTTIRSACRAAKAVNVAAGEDRFAAPLVFSNWRFDCKLSAKDTGGDLCIYDTARTGRGGPPMHVHRDQDEWFFVREGRYVFRIGDETFRLGPGDSLLAPRKIPHAFASLSETSSLLVAFQPAGSIEQLFFDVDRVNRSHPPTLEDWRTIASVHNAEIVGPPLTVSEFLRDEDVAADRRRRILRTLTVASLIALATYVVAAYGFAAVVKGAMEQAAFYRNSGSRTANWMPALWLSL